MKKVLLLLILFCYTVIAIAQKQIVVDPNVSVRSINKSFNSINISGGIDLYLSQSDKEEIAVSASEEKYKIGIKTVIENNILKIYYDGEKNWSKGNRKLRAYVSFSVLEKLEVSGAVDIIVAGEIKVPSLLLKLSGASDFKGAVSVSNLTIDLSGASDVNIKGSATNVKIETSGASDVKAYDLSTEICTVKASGASDVNITVNKELTAHASGASDIHFKGEAVIKDQHTAGASSLIRKNR